MQIKIYSNDGELVAERNYLSAGDTDRIADFNLSYKSNGIFFAKIMCDGIVKTRKIRIR
ncbi:MAG: hypothetical protein ACOCWA_01890 [Bacteroidota bacterium]